MYEKLSALPRVALAALWLEGSCPSRAFAASLSTADPTSWLPCRVGFGDSARAARDVTADGGLYLF